MCANTVPSAVGSVAPVQLEDLFEDQTGVSILFSFQGGLFGDLQFVTCFANLGRHPPLSADEIQRGLARMLAAGYLRVRRHWWHSLLAKPRIEQRLYELTPLGEARMFQLHLLTTLAKHEPVTRGRLWVLADPDMFPWSSRRLRATLATLEADAHVRIHTAFRPAFFQRRMLAVRVFRLTPAGRSLVARYQVALAEGRGLSA